MDKAALNREVQLLWAALEDEKQTVKVKNDVIGGLQQTLIFTEDRVRQLERELASRKGLPGGGAGAAKAGASPKPLVFDDDDEGMAFSPPPSMGASSPQSTSTGEGLGGSAEYWQDQFDFLVATTSGKLRYAIETTEEQVRQQVNISCMMLMDALWQQQQAEKESVRSTALAMSKMKEITAFRLTTDELRSSNEELKFNLHNFDAVEQQVEELITERNKNAQKIYLNNRADFLDEVTSLFDSMQASSARSVAVSNNLEKKIKRVHEDNSNSLDVAFQHFRNTMCPLAEDDDDGENERVATGGGNRWGSSSRIVNQRSCSMLDIHDVMVVAEYTDSARKVKDEGAQTRERSRVFDSFSRWLSSQYDTMVSCMQDIATEWSLSTTAVVQQKEGNVFRHILAAKRAQQGHHGGGGGALSSYADPNSAPISAPTGGGAPLPLADAVRKKEREMRVVISQLEDRLAQKTKLLAVQQAKMDDQDAMIGRLRGDLSKTEENFASGLSSGNNSFGFPGTASPERGAGGGSTMWQSKEATSLKAQLLNQAAALERLEQGAAQEWMNYIYGQFSNMMLGLSYYSLNSCFEESRLLGIQMYEGFRQGREVIISKERTRREWEAAQEKLAAALELQRDADDVEHGEPFGRLTQEEVGMIATMGKSEVEQTLSNMWYRSKVQQRNDMQAAFNSLFDSTFLLFLPTNRRLLMGTQTQITEESMTLVLAQKDQALTASHWLTNECVNTSRALFGLLAKVNTALDYKGSTRGGRQQATGQPSSPGPNRNRADSGRSSPFNNNQSLTNPSFLGVTTPRDSGESFPGLQTPLGGKTPMPSVLPPSINMSGGEIFSFSEMSDAPSGVSNMTNIAHVGGTGGEKGDDGKGSRRRDQIAAVASSSYFNSLCERLLQGVATMHKQMIGTEEVLTETQTALRESNQTSIEARSMMDEASVTQLVEREISDDVLVLMREILQKERTYSRNSICVLVRENEDRNITIRYLQGFVTVSMTSAHAAGMSSEYLWEAYHFVLNSYYDCMKSYLCFCRLNLLPSAEEVSNLFIYVHTQMGITLMEGCDALYEQFCDFKYQFQQLDYARKFYTTEAVRMSDELFAMAADRRLEKASSQWLESHLKENLLEGFLVQYQEHIQLHFEMSMQLNTTVTEKAAAVAVAATDRRAKKIAEKNLRSLEDDMEETKMAFDIVNEKAVESYKLLELRNQENKRLQDDVLAFENSKTSAHNQLAEIMKERDVLRSLLNAEQQAHVLSKEREDQKTREAYEHAVALQGSESETARWMALVEKEKEAHRATIRSLAKR